MTDLLIPLSSFKRLIKMGFKSGPVFESSGYVVTTVGGITVYSEKKTKNKIFDGSKKLGDQGERIKSLPYLKAGYITIAMGSGGGVDLTTEEAIEELETILDSYPEETQLEILKALGLVYAPSDRGE